MMRPLTAAALISLCFPAAAVDHAKFRTCDKTSFCRRHRGAQAARPWVVAPGSAVLDVSGRVTAQLHGGPGGVPLTLELLGYQSGVFRLRVTETKPLHGPRWEPDDILIDPEPAKMVVLDASSPAIPDSLREAVLSGSALAYGLELSEPLDAPAVLGLHLHPFQAELYVAGERVVELNPSGKFYFEHHRAKGGAAEAPAVAAPAEDVHQGKTVVDYGEDGLAVYSDGTKQERSSNAPDVSTAAEVGDVASENKGMWEESFGSHFDSKPFGPASVGLDVRFGGTQHLYGLAEHTAPFNLPSTTGAGAKYKEPYRLWTLDVRRCTPYQQPGARTPETPRHPAPLPAPHGHARFRCPLG
jgi:alpha 1,3-glucosidase